MQKKKKKVFHAQKPIFGHYSMIVAGWSSASVWHLKWVLSCMLHLSKVVYFSKPVGLKMKLSSKSLLN